MAATHWCLSSRTQGQGESKAVVRQVCVALQGADRLTCWRCREGVGPAVAVGCGGHASHAQQHVSH